MKFKAKIDLIYIFIYIVNILFGGLCIYGFLSIFDGFMAIILSVLIAFEIILISFMFFNCYYIVGDGKIKLVIGFISLTIKLSNITEINKCKNLAFSFALSRERFELKFGNSIQSKRNKAYVSVREEQKFLNAIKSVKS